MARPHHATVSDPAQSSCEIPAKFLRNVMDCMQEVRRLSCAGVYIASVVKCEWRLKSVQNVLHPTSRDAARSSLHPLLKSVASNLFLGDCTKEYYCVPRMPERSQNRPPTGYRHACDSFLLRVGSQDATGCQLTTRAAYGHAKRPKQKSCTL